MKLSKSAEANADVQAGESDTGRGKLSGSTLPRSIFLIKDS